MRHSQSGNTAINVALSLVVMLGFAAMGIDLTILKVYEQELHNSAEAAAHGGAAMLDGTSAGMTAARDAAVSLAAQNPVVGEPVVLDANTSNASDGDVVLGKIDSSGSFVPWTDPGTTTAVKAHAYRGGFGTFFAGLFGLTTVSSDASVIAVTGGPRTAECPIPIAVPSCALPTNPTDICNLSITMSDANSDNAAWALPNAVNPSASDISAAINGCTASSSTVDVLSLNNGQIQSVLNDLQTSLISQTTRWDSSEYGTMPTQPTTNGWVDSDGIAKGKSTVPSTSYGKVIVRLGMVYEDPSNCTNSQFNYDGVPILGYVTMVIYDIRTSNSNGYGRWVKMRIACDEAPEMSGGGFYGTIAPPRIVAE